MTAIVVDRFGGVAPRYNPSALPAFGAQVAENTRMHAGVLKGFRRPASLYPAVPVSAGTKSIFFDTGGNTWFSWTSVVDMVNGPVADGSAARRYYYTGDGAPKKTDATLAVTGGAGTYPRTWLNMGVPAPTNAPTATNDNLGSGTPAEDHVYVITYVSTFSGIKEEGPPSPPLTVAAWQSGDTVTVAKNNTAPTSGYNITHWRIYRSNGGNYLFVAEVAIGTPTYADNKLNTALAEAISSSDFDPPDAAMHSLVSMPNGILAGIAGNELCFCEPYQPHAWPVKYRIPVADIPVGLIVVGQGLYVVTEGRPALCTGLHPDSMTLEYAAVYAPCMSSRSLASDGKGIMYASYDGVIYVSGVDTQVMSEDMMTQEEWATFAPSSMLGTFYDGRYTLWYEVDANNRGSLHFDRTVKDAPLTLGTDYTTAYHIVAESGKLHVVEDDEVKETNGDLVNPRTPFTWKSKLFITPMPVNFKYGQVLRDATLSDAAAAYIARTAYNAALIAAGGHLGSWNAMPVNTYQVNGSALLTDIAQETESLILNVYADGVLVKTKTITSDEPFKMPSGFKASQWELEIIGTQPVRQLALATDIRELQSR